MRALRLPLSISTASLRSAINTSWCLAGFLTPAAKSVLVCQVVVLFMPTEQHQSVKSHPLAGLDGIVALRLDGFFPSLAAGPLFHQAVHAAAIRLVSARLKASGCLFFLPFGSWSSSPSEKFRKSHRSLRLSYPDQSD
jgi:hypothetical protein